MDPNYPNVILWAVPAFFGLAMVEMWWLRREHGGYETHDTAASLGMALGNLGVRFLPAGLAAWAMAGAYEQRLFDLGVSWPVVLACLLLYDLLFYFKHRWSHEIRWFWANHVVHHSSQHYNLSTALRQPWTGDLTGLAFMSVGLAWLGFHPLMIAFVAAIDLVYQFWIHTEAIGKLPWWFEAIFNTPSHHRVHHGSNPRYLDANYAGTFIIWDRMFGTFVPEQDEEAVTYGLVHNLDTFNPLRISFHEYAGMLRDVFRPGLTLGQRFGYLFGPPGWSHDGSRETVATLKKNYVARHPEAAAAPGLPADAETS